MAKYTVTRRQIINAINTENLTPGRFFRTFETADVKTCEVCAVGAVIRKAVPIGKLRKLLAEETDLDIGERVTDNEYCAAGSYSEVERALKDKNYMGALSMYFEKLCRSGNGAMRTCTPKVRTKLANFVRCEFPEKISFKL